MLFMQDRLSRRFAIGAWLGLAFSIAVILTTIGIMDGFGVSLKQGLRLSSGDITIFSEQGFFSEQADFIRDLKEFGVDELTGFVQSEGFAVANGVSKGILVRGVDAGPYAKISGQSLELAEREMIIGSELARLLEVEVGDAVGLVFAAGKKNHAGLPGLEYFRVREIVHYGIHQSDLRLGFIDKKSMQALLGIDDRVNMLTLNAPKANGNTEVIGDYAVRLRHYLGPTYSVRTYWSEFAYLLDVVQVEKFWIGMILQIIVIISIFNVLAFILFVNDQKGRELFLFKALGLSQKGLMKVWNGFVFLFWLAACVFSWFFVQLFSFLLRQLSLLNLPADVYYLGELSLSLRIEDYVLVFVVAGAWLFILSWIGLMKMRRQTILYGLRKEFS